MEQLSPSARERILKSPLPVLFVLLALQFGVRPLAAACAMEYAEEDWPPYVYRDTDGRWRGLDVELLNAIFKEADCRLTRRGYIPAARRELLLERGKLGLIAAASDIARRHVYARFSVAYRDETVGLFCAPENYERYARVRNFKDIEQARVPLLVPRAGWYGPDYEREMTTLKSHQRVSSYNSAEQALMMFQAGRAELIMGDSAGLIFAAAKAKLALKALPYVVSSNPVHLMLSRASTSEADLARIDAAIIRLEERGVLKAIRAAYGQAP
jgi:polar amino acid transport system substrate-binding protein